jgi:enterobactin synthetase component D / holo-[acyl-carrier protein] synthase
VLKEILPPATAVAATRDDFPTAELFPEEEDAVANAVEKRRLEFTTARACARAALAELGIPPVAVPVGPRGAPLWPTGIVGSITHCDGYRACAAARAEDLLTIGIDAEPDEPLPEGLLGDIAAGRERRWLRGAAMRSPGVSWDRLLFSIKESVYKAWFPLTGRWLGFEDAAVSIDIAGTAFAVRLLVPGPAVGDRELTGFSGRWLARDGLLLTAIAVPSGDNALRGPAAATK